MKEQTKAQLRAEIERLSGVVSYYRKEPESIDYEVYLLLTNLIDNNKSEIMEDLNYCQLNNYAVYFLNSQFDLLSKAAECLKELPKRDSQGQLLRIDNGTVDGGYA